MIAREAIAERLLGVEGAIPAGPDSCGGEPAWRSSDIPRLKTFSRYPLRSLSAERSLALGLGRFVFGERSPGLDIRRSRSRQRRGNRVLWLGPKEQTMHDRFKRRLRPGCDHVTQCLALSGAPSKFIKHHEKSCRP